VKTKEGGKMMSVTGKEGVRKRRKIGKKRDERERGGGKDSEVSHEVFQRNFSRNFSGNF
jgi:hypothetical protein